MEEELNTDKERMLAGLVHRAFSPKLLQERQATKHWCWRYNNLTSPLEVEKRKQLIHEMFGVDDAWIESPFQVDYGSHIKLGKGFYANHGCTILDNNRITIGDNVFLGPHVVISAASHPLSVVERRQGDEVSGPIVIGNDVWVGANATILRNVFIGNNVIIGAGAVVTKNVADNCVVGGVPAQVLRHLKGNPTDDAHTVGIGLAPLLSEYEF